MTKYYPTAWKPHADRAPLETSTVLVAGGTYLRRDVMKVGGTSANRPLRHRASMFCTGDEIMANTVVKSIMHRK